MSDSVLKPGSKPLSFGLRVQARQGAATTLAGTMTATSRSWASNARPSRVSIFSIRVLLTWRQAPIRVLYPAALALDVRPRCENETVSKEERPPDEVCDDREEADELLRDLESGDTAKWLILDEIPLEESRP